MAIKRRKSPLYCFLCSKLFCGLVMLELFTTVCFIALYVSAEQVPTEELQQVVIHVEDMKYERVVRKSNLVIYDNGIPYTFGGNGSGSEYSIREIMNVLDIGDEMHVTYYESRSATNTTPPNNTIVGAYTDQHIFRTVEDYYGTTAGLQPFLIIVFICFQIGYSGLIFLFFWTKRKS